MIATAVKARIITDELIAESEPLFRYGQRLTLTQGSGRIIGREYIDEETWQKFEDPECYAPARGWHYKFVYDYPSRVQGPIELFSEAQLIDAIA